MSEVERESMEADVLIVGGGPAGLGCALRLGQMKAEEGSTLADSTIFLLEKGPYVGAHAISGAVIDPRGLSELVGDFLDAGCPMEAPVASDSLYMLTENGRRGIPSFFPMLKNDGCYVASLHNVTKWLGERVEEAGIDILPGFPGQELLFDGDKVIGVRTGDRGLDKNGEQKSNFEPGVDIHARVVILADGARGNLTKTLVSKLKLDSDRNPQVYATGVKEVWEVNDGPLKPGDVYHTLGWPLSNEEYGGGFIYGMKDGLVSIGYAIGLDYRNPWTDPHGLMQDWKRHPMLREILGNGKMLNYGAKTIPEGGHFSVPKAAVDGCLLIGDAAGFLNAARLKGIHLALKTGMLAAETARDALASGDTSETGLSSYSARVADSWVGAELRSVRNFRQGFSGNKRKGMINAGLVFLTGGRGLKSRLPLEPDHTHMLKLSEMKRRSRPVTPPERVFDGNLTFDKLTDVYASGTTHEEDQPSHLLIADPDICSTRCKEEYGNPCQHFCPASVYEIIPSEGDKPEHLQVNFTNCVHCKTCDISDPYEIITWVPPEGGGGPVYVNL